MSNNNVEVVRRAYQAYAHGDLAAMLEFVDPELEWTYLDPTLQHPTPQVCHGRHELEQVLRGWAEHGVRAELEEVTSSGELVMVGVRTPGVDAHLGRRGDDRRRWAPPGSNGSAANENLRRHRFPGPPTWSRCRCEIPTHPGSRGRSIGFTRSTKLARSGDRITTPQMIHQPGVRTFPDRRPAP